jgi:hypothetical protein
MNEYLPALIPLAPAFFKPFFLTMKLAPMKKLDERARTRPLMLSEDIPSRQLGLEDDEVAISRKQKP